MLRCCCSIYLKIATIGRLIISIYGKFTSFVKMRGYQAALIICIGAYFLDHSRTISPIEVVILGIDFDDSWTYTFLPDNSWRFRGKSTKKLY